MQTPLKKRKSDGESVDDKPTAMTENTLTTSFKDAVKRANVQGTHITLAQTFTSIRTISLSVILQTITTPQFNMHSAEETRAMAWQCIEQRAHAKSLSNPNLAGAIKECVRTLEWCTHGFSAQRVKEDHLYSIAFPVLCIKPLQIPIFQLPTILSRDSIIEFSLKEQEHSLFESTQRLIGLTALNPFFVQSSKDEAMQSIIRNFEYYTGTEEGRSLCMEWNLMKKTLKLEEFEYSKRLLTLKNPNVAVAVADIDKISKEIKELEENIKREEEEKSMYTSNMDATMQLIAKYGERGEDLKQRRIAGIDETIQYMCEVLENKKQEKNEIMEREEKTKAIMDQLDHVNWQIKSITSEVSEIQSMKDGMWELWYDHDEIHKQLTTCQAAWEEVTPQLFDCSDASERAMIIRFLKDILSEKAVFYDGIYSIKRALDVPYL